MGAMQGALPSDMINVCTGVPCSTLELAQSLRELTGSSSEIGYGPCREGDVQRSVLEVGDPSPLGELVPLQEGLAKTVAWFKENA